MRSFITLECLCTIIVCEAFSHLIDRLIGLAVLAFCCVSVVLILPRIESPSPACIHSWGYRPHASAFKVARFSALQLRAIVCIRKTFDHSLIRLVAFLPMTQRELSQRDLTKENQYD